MLVRLSDLSAPRQALIRLCQFTNYGQIQSFEIRDCDPVLTPTPSVLVELKLDGDEEPRLEVGLADFIVRAEICQLLAHFDELKNGSIERIEVRGGIPRRVILKAPLEAWR